MIEEIVIPPIKISRQKQLSPCPTSGRDATVVNTVSSVLRETSGRLSGAHFESRSCPPCLAPQQLPASNEPFFLIWREPSMIGKHELFPLPNQRQRRYSFGLLQKAVFQMGEFFVRSTIKITYTRGISSEVLRV